ncbi:hypothetical protein BC2230_40303 [Burkholderia cepacia]
MTHTFIVRPRSNQYLAMGNQWINSLHASCLSIRRMLSESLISSRMKSQCTSVTAFKRNLLAAYGCIPSPLKIFLFNFVF